MTHRIANRKKQTRAGATTVEFAIAISILILIMFASIEFVRLNMLKHSVEHASYLAARKGIITGAKAIDVKSAAEDHLAILGVSNATVTVNPPTIKDDTQVVEVIIDLPMSGNTWVSPVYFSGTLSGRTRMLAERAAIDMMAAAPAPPPPPPTP